MFPNFLILLVQAFAILELPKGGLYWRILIGLYALLYAFGVSLQHLLSLLCLWSMLFYDDFNVKIGNRGFVKLNNLFYGSDTRIELV